MAVEEKNLGIKPTEIGLIASPEKRVPKYCTSVIVAKRSDGNLILTFISSDSPEEGGVVIERILIDEKHGENLSRAIKETIAAKETKI